MVDSLRSVAYRMILEWITSNSLPKGSVTSEIQLGKMLDMSRTPVRSALQQLEQEGYVKIVPKHGILVLDSSAKRVSNLLELLCSLMFFSISQSKNNISDDELSKISAKWKTDMQAMLLHPDQLDTDALCTAEKIFIQEVIAQCKNEEMDKLSNNTTERLFWDKNKRRWSPQYKADTQKLLMKLLKDLETDHSDTYSSLFNYFMQLRITWT